MASPDLTDTEAEVLRAVHAQEIADLYDLAQHDLVHVSGRHVRCTGTGDQWMRQHQ